MPMPALPETPRRTLAASLLAAASLAAGCGTSGDTPTPSAALPAGPPIHVGRAVCAECHEAQVALWQGSHHDLAMQEATEETVLGDFDGATLTHLGVTSTFNRREGRFMMRTDGPDGTLQDYEIAYTFGAWPLQQYLVAFPDGRYQATSLCWDARPEEQGGQRWFHLYPDEAVTHEDPLHWTASYQNWNAMCAECHSTRLRKGYQAEQDRYETTWFEIDVSCEACHGPGSNHVEIARSVAADQRPASDGDLGLLVRLTDSKKAEWVFDQETGIAKRQPPRAGPRTEVELCARCHSRRSVLSEDYAHGQPLMQTHRPSTLDEPLYHADGQILDEVYVYGSFLQSKMYREGVSCSDCHEPHGLGVRVSTNGVCSGCHLSERFDTPDHHRHEPGTPGAGCVDCHMPSRTYMVVDPRRDHSLRVPRPDLSVELGTPNACSGCHDDRPASWAADIIERWYGGKPRARHYGEWLHAGRQGEVGAKRALTDMARDAELSGIVRATALSLLRSYPTPATLGVLETASGNADPLVRSAALFASQLLPPEPQRRLATALLRDPVRGVRIEAARVLAELPPHDLAGNQGSFDRALAEYRSVLEYNADRAEAQVSLATLHLAQGRTDEAERAYRKALALTPGFMAAYVNLADLYRSQGRDREGEALLREAARREPDDPGVQHALGLLLIRQKRPQEALAPLQRAAELNPGVARYGLVFGVALDAAGKPTLALDVLQRVHERHPADPEVLKALAVLSLQKGYRRAAADYARKLLELTPDDPEARQILDQQ